jgi:hypothetical protein
MSSSKPQTAVFATFNEPSPCPISATGARLPDPEAAWESLRLSWLTPRPPSPQRQQRKAKDPVFVERLTALEQLLRIPAGPGGELGAGGGTAGGAARSTSSEAVGGDSVKGRVEDEIPDGGSVIREKAGDDLRRASEVRF